MVLANCQEKVDILLSRALEAAAIFSQMNQDQVDKVVKAVFEAAFKNRIKLAKMAAEETGLGRWEDKVIKNTVGSLFVYEDIKDMKTAGVISDDKESGIMEIAQPLGPVCAIIPVTNPTSTVMFKILIALKTRNPIIISPHQKAIGCCAEAVRICYEAALNADAPEYCIQITRDEPIDFKSFDLKEYYAETQAVMSHPKLALILATGGSGVVKAAYTSGTPALGVGSGNVPVLIDKTADIPFAVSQILISKTFDNGTICASEQAIVVEKCIADEVRAEFKKQKCYFLSDPEVKAVEAVAYDKERRLMSANVVGQPVSRIATLAGIKVPSDTKVLMAPLKGVGYDYPLSSEILCPLLAFYEADDFEECLKICIDLNFFGGMGHSASIYANDESKIRQFSIAMSAGRILVNTPSSQGAVGGIFNKLRTSLTLGCGTAGKNITTDNVTAKNLINIQRVARRRINERFENFCKIERNGNNLLFDADLDVEELQKYFNLNY